MVFMESPIFEKLISGYLNDDEYAELQMYMVEHPQAGTLIPRSGGVRKLRWRQPGYGKRGGLRVIYYLRNADLVWLLTIYAKGDATNIPAHVLRKIKEELDNGKT